MALTKGAKELTDSLLAEIQTARREIQDAHKRVHNEPEYARLCHSDALAALLRIERRITQDLLPMLQRQDSKRAELPLAEQVAALGEQMKEVFAHLAELDALTDNPRRRQPLRLTTGRPRVRQK